MVGNPDLRFLDIRIDMCESKLFLLGRAKGASLEWHCRVASDFRCSVYVVPDEVGFAISS